MRRTHLRTVGRGACVAAALPAGCWLLWCLVREPCMDLAHSWATPGIGALPFPQALVGICAWAAVIGSAWVAGTATLVAGLGLAQTAIRGRTTAGVRRRSRIGEVLDAAEGAVGRLCPGLVRRLVLGCCGIALGGGLGTGLLQVPAEADSGSADPAATSPLRGLEVPDRTVGARASATRVTVGRGDSLWSISADHLPRSATRAELTAAWHQLHRSNRERIGTDPDLIFPGTTLRVPPLAHLNGKEGP